MDELLPYQIFQDELFEITGNIVRTSPKEKIEKFKKLNPVLAKKAQKEFELKIHNYLRYLKSPDFETNKLVIKDKFSQISWEMSKRKLKQSSRVYKCAKRRFRDDEEVDLNVLHLDEIEEIMELKNDVYDDFMLTISQDILYEVAFKLYLIADPNITLAELEKELLGN